MNELEGTAVLVGLFALRCIAPLIITLAVGYTMNRLVDRWMVEDELQAESGMIPVEEPEPASGIKLPTITVPCWILRNCDPAKQAECAARKQPGLPCWMARTRHEGNLPNSCPDCPIYAQAMVVAT